MKFRTNIFNKKLPSGALQLAVIISFIVILLCSFFILFNFLSSRVVDREQLLLRKIHNANSLVDSKIHTLSLEEGSGVDFYHEQDSIHWKVSQWGAYQIITTEIKGSLPVKQSYFLGNAPDSLRALYVQDDDQYVSISGKTHIKGIVYAPRLGLRPRVIGNTHFTGTYDAIEKSDKTLPALNFGFDSNIKKLFALLGSVEYTQLSNEDSLINSFYEETKVVYTPEYIPQYLRGNIIIVDEEKVELNSSHNCKDIIIVAPYIIVKSGFKGTAQLFATDSIVVETGAILEQASFLAIYREELTRDVTPIIRIEKKAKVSGGMYMNVPSFYKHYPSISIEEGAEVLGNIYSENFVDNKGYICGYTITKALLAKTRQGYMFNTVIDAKFAAIPTLLPMFCPNMSEAVSRGIIKKLY